ncbi:hypothetical protein [Halorussus sp. MSC15.2]|uniref:hypothetical protein n=1 Tax=Halorussus sp. MSC15.2 TaxID=2283638 RepID=UPI0013D8A54F|nr:hypothetical protein [Halorussus sp. MSC15.2]NEU58244.1 hypothetical protein [Halorussus sp. MSC15.2]
MVNAFWLDRDLDQTARWLVDRHVLSSVLENAMVLTTAVQSNGYAEGDPETREDLYFSHADHPLTRWAAAHPDNWEYLHDYTEAAHDEWRYRWNHPPEETHGSWATVESLDRDEISALDWPGEPSDPPQVTGQWHADDYVEAYRLYYANEKRHLFEWSGDRTAPPWLDDYRRDSP